MNLKNKVAVITGGSSGIGRAICLLLKREGCKVIFTYNSRKKEAEDLKKILGSGTLAVNVDLHKDVDIENLFSLVEKEHGTLDILINNAGQNRPRELLNLDTWREIFQVNLFAVVKSCDLAIKLMKDSGRILNISSIYAEDKACWKGLPAYGASKASINHLTRILAKNFSPKILVNAIAPGYVQTPLWKDTSEEAFIEAGKEQLIERMIQPEEIADMAIAVVKNDAMTGEVVVVDGGISLKTI